MRNEQCSVLTVTLLCVTLITNARKPGWRQTVKNEKKDKNGIKQVLLAELNINYANKYEINHPIANK